ncbi:hypothetical protein DPMN_025309 [Dreissena polymorpha]|uniref:Uncharacterized protein n=1 Tax=Dreissena polymorpha TaxID=45954 RepID=A0A9D4LPL3_DREPO|nr:hypothetical protein DPMN_025309 [Dreissena polymorpha]
MFHEEQTVNLSSRVHIMKNDPPRGDTIGTNLLANSHDDRTIKVDSRVLTRPYALLPGNHFFQTTFHEDRTLNLASRLLTRKNAPPSWGHSRVLTRFYYSHIWPYY